MVVRRSKANARRALRLLVWAPGLAALAFFALNRGEAELELWRKIAIVTLMAILFFPPEKLVAGASRRSAAWILEHDAAWRVATLVLYVRAPFHWLVTVLGKAVQALVRTLWAALGRTRAFQFLNRHRRTVCIFLVAAMSLRSLAAIGLLQQSAEVSVWHWAALGPTYLLFGVTAPFVALLLLMRKGEWVLVTALMWLLTGLAATALALLFSLWWSAPLLPLLVYPMFPEPLHVSLFLAMGFAELLAQVAAIHYLGGRTADYYHGLESDAV